ncbi:MAG: hypothetical protein WBG04_07865 [Haloferula sp.]
MLVVVLAGCMIGWHTLLIQRSSVSAESPDARHIAVVQSSFPMFGDYHYDIEVRRSDGVLISRMEVRDKLFGWARDPSIEWADDSTTVTIGIRDGDAEGGNSVARKRISIDVP